MSRWELYFHIVWATKWRQPFLIPPKEEAVYRGILSLIHEAGYEVLELNGMPDHVHLLLRTGPAFDLSRLMKRVKGSTSSLVNDMTDHQAHFRWQEGYSAATVTPSHVPKIRTYIQNQKEHHLAGTTYAYWEDTGDGETEA